MGELANKVRAKYPGAYDAIPDAELESKVMAKYPGVYDHLAGSSEWVGDTSGRSVKDMERQFILDEGRTKTQKVLGAVSPYIRPVLEVGGATAGGLIGGTAGGAAGGIGALPGGVAGAALGYAGGKNIADTIDEAAGLRDGGTLADRAITTAGDLATGATYEMGGQAAVPVLKGVAKATGAVVKPVLGRLSGVGTEAIEQGLKSGEKQPLLSNPFKSQTAYDRAMRGKMSGEEIVDSARNALTRLKDTRLQNYQSKLAEVEANTGVLDMAPIKDELTGLMGKYNVKIDPATGAVDTSRIAMGKTGRNDIEEIINTVNQWGSQAGDDTAVGLDTLKRQLDDFYSDSSQARQFVASLKNKVKDTIVKSVPEYGEMTKGYSDATKLIKDVEAGLMMRKQGMTGRITADQTLNRLLSAMKNEGTKKELIDILGNQGGEDLMGAVSGYAASNIVPRGLAGTGPALIGNAALAKFVDPSFAGVILASSPRVQGEFLRIVGKARGFDPKFIEQTIKGVAITNRPTNAREAQDRFKAMKGD